MEVTKLALNVVGFVLALTGTGVTLRAMSDDYRAYAGESLPKFPSRARAFVVTWARTLTFRRPPSRTIVLGAALERSTAVGEVHVVKTGAPIPDEATDSEKIALLISQIQLAEEQAQADRDRSDRKLQEQIDRADARETEQRAEIQRLEKKIEVTATDSLPTQVRGLLLATFGTMLTAAADIIPGFVEVFGG